MPSPSLLSRSFAWSLSTRSKAVAVWVVASLHWAGCADHLTAQLPEPGGPLRITKLTLLDKVSRDAGVFTDTSLPNCADYPTERCSRSEEQQSEPCRVCYNDVWKDKYSVAKSPPTPDSATDLRVVFNKIPRNWNGLPINADAVPEGALRLLCEGTCQGIPPHKRLLDISGSTLTFDPLEIPYGPSLRIAVDRAADPRFALEPGATYSVFVDVGVADRHGETVDLQDTGPLLRFQTEPLKVLRIGRGDEKGDLYVHAQEKWGDGSSQSPYGVTDLASNHAIVVAWNAALHPGPLAALSLPGSVKQNDGSTGAVAVLVGLNILGTDADGKVTRGKPSGCVQQNQRQLLFWPDTPDLRWPVGALEVTFTLPAQSAVDLAQKTGFGLGNHPFGKSLTVRAKLSGKDAAPTDPGLTTVRAKAAAGTCMYTATQAALSVNPTTAKNQARQ